jgi:hypothetical protein
VARLELAQPAEVARTRIVEHAQHEGRGFVPDRDFDLGHPAADVERADEFRERRDEVAHRRGQHVAGLEIGK